jgi:hypothetical protein
VIAVAEGIDPERVNAIARAVREAGLIATRGRGPAAARMSEYDAANLLIAVNVADTARSAPETVERYRQLQAKTKKQTTEFGIQFENMLSAARTHTMSDYVPDLLRFAPWRSPLLWDGFALRDYRITIEFKKPAASICITIWSRKHSGRMPDFVNFYDRREKSTNADADREVRTKITERTILAVSKVLRRGSRP